MALITISLYLISLAAYPGVKLLDLAREGKLEYETGCDEFIQKVDRSSLQSNSLRKMLIKLKEMPNRDAFFFHYTFTDKLGEILNKNIANRNEAHEKTKAENGYKSIMEYQMSKSTMIFNESGVGIYVSSNPFSSAQYGKNQIMFEISEEANVLDLSRPGTGLYSVMSELEQKNPGLSSCVRNFKRSLILNENNVDITNDYIPYDYYVILNEDVILQTHVTEINTTSRRRIINKMLNAELAYTLIENIEELGYKGDFFVKLSEIKLDSRLEDWIKEVDFWTPGIKSSFKKMIENYQGTKKDKILDLFPK